MDGKPFPPPPPRDETWVMGTPITPQYHPASHQATWIPIDCTPAASAASAGYNPSYANRSAAAPNPYIHLSPVPRSTGTNETICKVMDRCGKKLEDSTKKAGDLVTNVWHHLKTGPSITDAAMARLAQGTKVFAEGGNERVFQLNFGTYTGEKLRKTFACYLSTSTGPVIGTLYLSSLRLAFYSDKALCHYTPSGQQEWLHYKMFKAVLGVQRMRTLGLVTWDFDRLTMMLHMGLKMIVGQRCSMGPTMWTFCLLTGDMVHPKLEHLLQEFNDTLVPPEGCLHFALKTAASASFRTERMLSSGSIPISSYRRMK